MDTKTLTPEGVSCSFCAYFTTRVRETGDRGKVFAEPAGVADGIAVIV